MALRKALLTAAVALAMGSAQAQVSDGVIKIGVLNDQSGLYADLAGQGSVVAARMAVEDFGAAKKGMKVEIISADHQNKPEVGSSIARGWYDVDKVDVIVDVPTSSVTLAVNQVTREKGKALLVSSGGTSNLTGEAFVKSGASTWFLLIANYAYGHAVERDVEAVVLEHGGTVVGKVRHPFP